MAAIARLLSGNLQSDQNDLGTLKMLGMFCGADLFVSLLLATYGLDLSPGFF
jgi:hypothetical protein